MRENNISIAMCTYNGENYLNQQLASIASQTCLPIELVICDDNSKDNTLKIIDEFSKNVPFEVRLYENETNLGSTKNFEKSINLCKGDLIVLSDQDDIWKPKKLETIRDHFLNGKTGAIFSDAILIDDSLSVLKDSLWKTIKFTKHEQKKGLKGEMFEVLMKHKVVTGATMAFRAKYINLISPIPEVWVHDAWISLILSIFSEIVPIQKSLVKYRQHTNQQIGTPKNFLETVKKAKFYEKDVYRLEVKKYKKVYEFIELKDMSMTKKKEILGILEEKISHLKSRRKIHETKQYLKRVPLVFKEILSLRYFNYSGGFKSFIKDLFL